MFSVPDLAAEKKALSLFNILFAVPIFFPTIADLKTELSNIDRAFLILESTILFFSDGIKVALSIILISG